MTIIGRPAIHNYLQNEHTGCVSRHFHRGNLEDCGYSGLQWDQGRISYCLAPTSIGRRMGATG